MKVFISWSGERSRAVALKLREWLPVVIHFVEPWMSSHDIDAGAKWLDKISQELKETKFGIICLTKENLDANWLLFESGAISKSLENAYVCPYLIDMDPSDIPSKNPLSNFQAKRANEKETFELLKTINSAGGEKPIPDDRLNKLYTSLWNDLDTVLKNLPATPISNAPDVRSNEEMTAEVLELAREMQRQMQNLVSPYILDRIRVDIAELRDEFANEQRRNRMSPLERSFEDQRLNLSRYHLNEDDSEDSDEAASGRSEAPGTIVIKILNSAIPKSLGVEGVSQQIREIFNLAPRRRMMEKDRLRFYMKNSRNLSLNEIENLLNTFLEKTSIDRGAVNVTFIDGLLADLYEHYDLQF